MTPTELDEIKREVVNLKAQVLRNQALILAVARSAGVTTVSIRWANASTVQRLEALEYMLSRKPEPAADNQGIRTGAPVPKR